jgi:hypothetical protein
LQPASAAHAHDACSDYDDVPVHCGALSFIECKKPRANARIHPASAQSNRFQLRGNRFHVLASKLVRDHLHRYRLCALGLLQDLRCRWGFLPYKYKYPAIERKQSLRRMFRAPEHSHCELEVSQGNP